MGPWSKILLEQNNIKSQKDIDYIKGSHLIINRKSEFGLMFSGVCKSRYIFALPYQDYTLLGTTEEKVSHPELPEISKNEIKYLIDSFNYILKKSISKKEIISSYSGVRPLIKSKDNMFIFSPLTDKVSFRHRSRSTNRRFVRQSHQI